MRGNLFMGDGFFGQSQGALPRQVALSQRGRYGYRPSAYATPPARRWSSQSTPETHRTSPTAQPTASKGSEVGCYFCAGLDGAPTYWMSEAQADTWNQMRNAQCTKVPVKECQQKYGQMRSQASARLTRTGFNAFNLPAAAVAAPVTMTTPGGYGATMMSGISISNPEFLG